MRRDQLEQWAHEADARYDLDPGQMYRLITQESGWNPAAVSSAGARGLTQFMPATAKEWGVDLNDPKSQIDKGAEYLAYLRDYFGGDTQKALAAYNWGMGNVEKKGLANMPDETRNYLHATYAGPGIPAAQAPQGAPPAPQMPVPATQGQFIPAGAPQPAPGAREAFFEALQPEPMQARSLGSHLADLAPVFMTIAGLPEAGQMMMQARLEQKREDRERRRMMREQRLNALYKAAFPEDTRTAQQKNIEYYAQNPQAFEMAKQLAAAQQPPSYGLAFDPTTGAGYRFSRTSPDVQQVTEGVTPEQRQAQAAQAAKTQQEQKLGLEQGKQAIKALPEIRSTLDSIDYELASARQLLADVQSAQVAGPGDYSKLLINNPALADRLDFAFSQGAVDRLGAIKGAPSDRDLALVLKGTMPSLWRPGEGGEQAVRQNLEQRIKGLERLKSFNEAERQRYESQLPESEPPSAAPMQPTLGMAPGATINPATPSPQAQRFEDLDLE